MPLVLEIVKHGHGRARTEDWSREAGVEKPVQLQPTRGERQPRLLPYQTTWTKYRIDGLPRVIEVRRRRHQIRSGFTVGEDEVLILMVDLRQSLQQIAEIDLGSTHSAWDQVQRIDADS